MESEIASSLINLTAALLIFLAAIIPIAYGIWKKANSLEARSIIKAALFSALNYILLFAAFASLNWLASPRLGLLFFFLNWAMWAYYFLAPKQPPTRFQIFMFVISTVLLGIFAVFTLLDILLQALSISSE